MYSRPRTFPCSLLSLRNKHLQRRVNRHLNQSGRARKAANVSRGRSNRYAYTRPADRTRARACAPQSPCASAYRPRSYPYPSNIRPVRPASLRSIKLTFDDTRDRSVTSVPSLPARLPLTEAVLLPPYWEPISSERYRRFDSIRRYLATRQGAIVVSGNCYCAFEAAAVVVAAAASLAVLQLPHFGTYDESPLPIFLFSCSSS